MRRRTTAVAALALSGLAAWASGAAAQEAAVPGVAVCLRAPLPGAATLWRAEPGLSSGVSLFALGERALRAAWSAPLGVATECPVTVAAPGGAVVVAAGRLSGAGVIVLRRGADGAAVRTVLATPGAARRDFAEVTDMAVSVRGDVAVAWRQSRFGPRAFSARAWVAVQRPGARFSKPMALDGWQRVGAVGAPVAQIGFDAASSLTAVWSGQRRGRGLVFTRAWPSAAPPGAVQSFAGPLADTDVNPFAFAVAPAGAAILVARGGGGVVIFERPGPGRRFRRQLVAEGDTDWQSVPALAVRHDSALAAAWRLADGRIRFAVRPPSGGRIRTGTTGGPTVRRRDTTREVVIGNVPRDLGNLSPHIGFAGPDSVVVSWVAARSLAALAYPPAAWMAVGTVRGRFGRARPLGSPCRSVNGTSPVPGRAVPAVLFTDNLTEPLAGDIGSPDSELPRGGGRLHLSERPTAPPVAQPIRLRVSAPPHQRLRYAQPLRIRVACDRECDLRAVVPGRHGRVRALGTASLDAPGQAAMRLRPGLEDNLAAPPGRPTPVSVYACVPNGPVAGRRDLAVSAIPLPAPEPPAVIGLRARRELRGVRVTGRLSRRQRRGEGLLVGAYRESPDDPILDRPVRLGRRTTFSVLLPSAPLASARWVTAVTISTQPPFRTRTFRARIAYAGSRHMRPLPERSRLAP